MTLKIILSHIPSVCGLFRMLWSARKDVGNAPITNGRYLTYWILGCACVTLWCVQPVEHDLQPIRNVGGRQRYAFKVSAIIYFSYIWSCEVLQDFLSNLGMFVIGICSICVCVCLCVVYFLLLFGLLGFENLTTFLKSCHVTLALATWFGP